MENNELLQNPEIEAYRVAIEEENEKLNKKYAEIGQLYAEKHAEDYEYDFSDLMVSVVASKAKIAECQAEIDKLNGMVRCEVCGVCSPDDVAFCSACGAKLPGAVAPAVVDENKIPCMACGNLVDKSFAFCTACGKSVADSMNYLAGTYVAEMHPVAETQPVVEAQPIFEPAPIYAQQVYNDQPIYNAEPQPYEVPVYQPPVAEPAKCPACGAALMEGALFCTECGTRL